MRSAIVQAKTLKTALDWAQAIAVSRFPGRQPRYTAVRPGGQPSRWKVTVS